MKITNKVTDPGYVQWIEQFVANVITQSEVTCEEVIIEDIEYSKRIFLDIDGEEYVIRTWSFHPIEKDAKGYTCAEMVDYTLFKMIEDDIGIHGEEIHEGTLAITWKN